MAGNSATKKKDRFAKRRAIKEDSYKTARPTQPKLETPEKRKAGEGNDITQDSAKKSKIQPGEPLAKDIGAPTFTPQEFDIEKVEGLDWYGYLLYIVFILI